MSIDELARRLRVSVPSVRDWLKKGAPRAYLPSGKLDLSLPEVTAWRAENLRPRAPNRRTADRA